MKFYYKVALMFLGISSVWLSPLLLFFALFVGYRRLIDPQSDGYSIILGFIGLAFGVCLIIFFYYIIWECDDNDVSKPLRDWYATQKAARQQSQSSQQPKGKSMFSEGNQ